MPNPIRITISINPETGEIMRVEGPLHMKAFMIDTLAEAIHIVVNQEPPPVPEILMPANGKEVH